MNEPGGAPPGGGARIAAAAEASADAILAIDAAGRVVTWNAGAERLFGRDAADVVGQPVLALFPVARHAEVEALLARVRQGVRLPPRDTRALRRDGREVDVAVSASVMGDPAAGLSLVVRDVTERKLAEREAHLRLVETQRHQRALEAVAEIRLALLAGRDLAASLSLIARLARDLAGAAGVVVLVPHGERFELVAADGDLVADLAGAQVPSAGTVAETALRSGRTQSVDGPVHGALLPEVSGPVLHLPMVGADGPVGVVCILRPEGERPFEAEEVRLLAAFAEQATLALTLDSGRRDREELSLVADRERIARDLHDHVIQRLFAVGMSLEAARTALGDDPAARRVAGAVEELDDTIRQIRSVIFSLEVRSRHPERRGLRRRVLEVAERASVGLGFSPRLLFEGPVEARVPDTMVSDVEAVVRETLSNAARHAGASELEVVIGAGADLVITVSDNGRGLGQTERSSGLANLRARAQQHGGILRVEQPESGGTCVEWRVPLPSSL